MNRIVPTSASFFRILLYGAMVCTGALMLLLTPFIVRQFASARVGAGFRAYAVRDYRTAERMFSQARWLGDDRPRERAFAVYHLGRRSEALAILRSQQSKDPEDTDAIGVILVENGDLMHGLAMIRHAVERDPGDPVFRHNLATTLILSGARREGVTERAKAEQLSHGASRNWSSLVIARKDVATSRR